MENLYLMIEFPSIVLDKDFWLFSINEVIQEQTAFTANSPEVFREERLLSLSITVNDGA